MPPVLNFVVDNRWKCWNCFQHSHYKCRAFMDATSKPPPLA